MTHNIQLRLPEKDLNRGQVSVRIDKIDKLSRTLIIGPVVINWSDETRFDKITTEQLMEGKTLKVSGSLDKSSGKFNARNIIQESSPFAPGSLQITGHSGISTEREDGIHEFFLLGVLINSPQNGFNTFKSLIRRRDVRRPDNQFKFNILGKPVTLGGEYDLNPGYRGDFDLDHHDSDDSVKMDQELKLEAFYLISDFSAVFLSFKGITSSRFNVDSDRLDKTTAEIARDETWVFFDRNAGTGFGLQFGNQNVSETREWWWVKDMDALRLYYNRGPFHFELTGGKQLGGDRLYRALIRMMTKFTGF